MFNDIKILGKQSFIYGIGIILSRGLGFFLIPLYTHYLSPKDYGIMEMLDLIGGIISIFLAMGLTNSILRFHAFYDDQKEKDQVKATRLDPLTDELTSLKNAYEQATTPSMRAVPRTMGPVEGEDPNDRVIGIYAPDVCNR